MGRKPAGPRKCIYLSIAGLIFLSLFGCAALEKTTKRIEVSTASAETKETKKRKGTSALFIPGGLFVGMGIGFATNNLVPGLFIGLGAGFIIFALLMVLMKD